MSTTMTPAALETAVRVPVCGVFRGALPPARHRAIHLGLLHQQTAGYVEIAAWRRAENGAPPRTSRADPGHFLPGGASSQQDWLAGLLGLAERHHQAGEEVFVGALGRQARAGHKQHVTHGQFVWVDIDDPAQLPRLYELHAQRPAHLIIESGGSGGRHAYWKLDQPLPAITVTTTDGHAVTNPVVSTAKTSSAVTPTYADPATGEMLEGPLIIDEWIERANQRLVALLGGDRQSRDRSRILRLAGTINHKSANWCRIEWADLALPGYPIATLVGDLPDPVDTRPRRVGVALERNGREDWRRIDPPEYFERIAGLRVATAGWVRCPAHDDQHPSCRVYDQAERGWSCFACGAGGSIIDLAAAKLGLRTGRALRGEDYKHARAMVEEIYGEP
jgi:hypothetical protein